MGSLTAGDGRTHPAGEIAFTALAVRILACLREAVPAAVPPLPSPCVVAEIHVFAGAVQGTS